MRVVLGKRMIGPRWMLRYPDEKDKKHNEALTIKTERVDDIPQPMPNDPSRLGRVKSGELDAIFEEGILLWGNMVSEAGMHFLPIDDQHLTKLEAQGFGRATIKTALHPTLPTDVPTVDFSGWP